jgi:NitT/TauT family transport system permease protein
MPDGSQVGLARRVSDRWLPAITFLLLLIIWEIAVRLLKVPTFVLPPPSIIGAEMWNVRAQLIVHSAATLLTTVYAFVVTVLVTIPVAVLITAFPLLRRTIYPLIVLSQAVPKIAVAPLLVVLLGSGEAPKIVIAFLVAFFPLLVDTTTGLNSVPSDLLELSRSLRSTRLQEFVKIRFPTAVPFFFSGLKVAVAFSVLGAVVAEFVQSDRGLGYLIVVSTSYWKTPLAFAAIVILAALGLALFFLVAFIERRFFSWYSHS